MPVDSIICRPGDRDRSELPWDISSSSSTSGTVTKLSCSSSTVTLLKSFIRYSCMPQNSVANCTGSFHSLTTKRQSVQATWVAAEFAPLSRRRSIDAPRSRTWSLGDSTAGIRSLGRGLTGSVVPSVPAAGSRGEAPTPASSGSGTTSGSTAAAAASEDDWNRVRSTVNVLGSMRSFGPRVDWGKWLMALPAPGNPCTARMCSSWPR